MYRAVEKYVRKEHAFVTPLLTFSLRTLRMQCLTSPRSKTWGQRVRSVKVL